MDNIMRKKKRFSMASWVCLILFLGGAIVCFYFGARSVMDTNDFASRAVTVEADCLRVYKTGSKHTHRYAEIRYEYRNIPYTMTVDNENRTFHAGEKYTIYIDPQSPAQCREAIDYFGCLPAMCMGGLFSLFGVGFGFLFRKE